MHRSDRASMRRKRSPIDIGARDKAVDLQYILQRHSCTRNAEVLNLPMDDGVKGAAPWSRQQQTCGDGARTIKYDPGCQQVVPPAQMAMHLEHRDTIRTGIRRVVEIDVIARIIGKPHVAEPTKK